MNANDINRIVADQLAEVLEETGPAILISALTNITADVVGSFTGSPEITLLCVGNIASVCLSNFALIPCHFHADHCGLFLPDHTVHRRFIISIFFRN